MKMALYITLILIFFSCTNSNTPTPITEPIAQTRELKLTTQLNQEEKLIAFKLDTFFMHLNKSGAFNGSILVGKQGKVIFKKSFGIVSKVNNKLLNDSSLFQLASVSKIITATAILILQEKKLLDITKPFKYYFPDFPYNDVSIRQLLNHRSGLANYIYVLEDEIKKPNYKMSNVDMYCHFIAKQPKPYLKAGERFNYCNTNYALLGLLIEKISGKSYSQFLQDEIFKPLGMKHTTTIRNINFMNDTNVTTAYNHKWNQINTDASDYVLGDKSIYSNPSDLFLFSEALYQNKLLSKQTQQLAYTPYSPEKKVCNYGFGWRLTCWNDSLKKEVFHNGWWHGYRSSFHRRLNDQLTVIILSNQLNRSAYKTYKVYQIVDNKPLEDTLGYSE